MKRALSLVLALLLVSALALPAMAETTELTINYAPEIAYTLVVPNGQTITPGQQVDIGMVTLSDTKNFQGHYLDVTVTASQFVGQNTNNSYDSGLYWKDADGNICGDGGSYVLTFPEIDEASGIGALKNTAHLGENTVTQLGVQCYLNALGAPADTYKATVTFTGEVKAFTQINE